MFDIGGPELLVVAIVLIVIVGPKDLPRMLRTFGRTTSKMRDMASDFRKQFDDALKEAELDDVKGLSDQARSLDPRKELRKHLSPLEQAGKDIRSGFDEAMKPKPAEGGEPAAADTHEAEPAKTAATNTPATTEPGSKTGGNGSSARKKTKAGSAASQGASADTAGAKKSASGGRKRKSGSSATSGSATASKKAAGNGAKKPAASAQKKSESGAQKKPAASKSASKSARQTKSPAKSSVRGKASGTVS